MKTLKIEELSKNFGTTEVLRKINLEIDEGNFLVLLGPSGCGKSTLLNIIAGLETINEGNVFIDDYNVSKVEPKDRNIAMVFQSYALYPSMNVRENMIFGLKQAKTSKEKIEEQLEKVSKFLQVDQLLERKPSQLSGGQRQRVAIGRALVREPRIFLFDEPLSNLDAKLRRQVREDIREIQQKLGVTTIYVTHDQEEALAISDKVIVMNNAIIAQQGSPKELYNFPKTKFVANFIGDANVVKAEIINQNNNIYEIQLAEMKINIESDQKLESSVSVSLRPEKITISKSPEENSIHASVNNASFVGNSYQYIVNSKVGKIYVVSSDTNEIFNVGENVYLKFDEKELRLLND